VGNPLLDELPLQRTRGEARARIGLESSAQVLTLLPGSRPAEVRRHLEPLLDAAVRAAAVLRQKGTLAKDERLVVGVAFPLTASRAEVEARVANWIRKASGGQARFILDVRVSMGQAHDWMIASDAGLIKSGTSTLEAALLGCPHAIVYKTTWLTDWIFRFLIRYAGPVGLTNLVYGGGSKTASRLVREWICGQATEVALMGEVVQLLSDPVERERQRVGFAEIRDRLRINAADTSPSDQAALAVLELLELPRKVRP
jgi:lipid-A-disaccharide synthase